MFSESADVYDAIYGFKDHAAEAAPALCNPDDR
jgi:hypothetical protein